MSISNLDGFFLRLRLGKWEEGLGGTRYYVASITGTTGITSCSIFPNDSCSFLCYLDQIIIFFGISLFLMSCGLFLLFLFLLLLFCSVDRVTETEFSAEYRKIHLCDCWRDQVYGSKSVYIQS